jgi:regulator of replication initiation timing
VERLKGVVEDGARERERVEHTLRNAEDDLQRAKQNLSDAQDHLRESKDENLRLTMELRAMQTHSGDAEREVERVKRSFSIAEENLIREKSRTRQLEEELNKLVGGAAVVCMVCVEGVWRKGEREGEGRRPGVWKGV